MTLDVDVMAEMWLPRDYLPEMAAQDRRDFPSLEQLAEPVARALAALARDLESGEWDRRYGHLREQGTLDVGLRLVCAELHAE